jgi:radical SAM protein with 4Fe4S-binding SPASM domain
MYSNLISNDIFDIPIGREYNKPDDDINIVYSPFTDNALIMTNEYVQKMEAYLENPENKNLPEDLDEAIPALLDFSNRKKCAPLAKSPYEYRRIAILPNNVCNFKCSYCYSAQGRSGKIISKDTLKTGLDIFIDPKRISTDNKLEISILGGGEPLLSWELVKFIIEYSNERANRLGFKKVDCNLVTNGSVFTQEIIDTLKAYHVPVSISFEILEEIQKLQRGNYEKVARNIDWIISEGIRPQLRSTITEQNIRLMKRMIEEVLQRFPGTREVMMEYVTDPETMTNPERVREFYQLYIDHFFEAHDYAAAHGLLLDCSAYRNFNLLIERFCPGDNTLTPDGEISICSRIGAPQDLGYEDSIYGKINTNGVMEIDREKFDRLIGLNVRHYRKCKDCFAKWHCAGGCLIHKYTYNESIQNEICEYMRNFTKRMILRSIEKEYVEHYGVSLQEAINGN